MNHRILPRLCAAVAALFVAHLPLRGAALLVSNFQTNTIERIDESGGRSVFASGLNQPRGLVFDDAGLLYVANANSNEILTFAPDGTRAIFATEKLNGPRGLAIDEVGTLFATNGTGNSVVKNFTCARSLRFRVHQPEQPAGFGVRQRGQSLRRKLG